MGNRNLVIEDNPANVALMTYLLNALGHTTIVARDGEEGVEAALRTTTPDSVLCDLALPRLDGHAVARRLKAESSLKGIVMMSSKEQVLACPSFSGLFNATAWAEAAVDQGATFHFTLPK